MLLPEKISIGVDLGGTSVRVGLFDQATELLATEAMTTRVADGPEAVITDIITVIDRLLAKIGLRRADADALAGIGIGSPGPINLRTGRLGHLPNFPGWDGFPLTTALTDAAGLPVFLECDANAAALAEWKFGAGREAQLDSLAMVTLGTGVGSGIILEGRVWHGMVGMGGEAGHISLNPSGPPCGCGGRGCLETYASASGLVRLAQGAAQRAGATDALRSLVASPTSATAKHVAALAEAGDQGAIQAYAEFGWWLGFGLTSLVNILDLPMIVIGGGVTNAWHLFAPAMFDALREHSYVYRLGEPSQRETLESDRTFIRPALLGPQAGLLGAGLLPRFAL